MRLRTKKSDEIAKLQARVKDLELENAALRGNIQELLREKIVPHDNYGSTLSERIAAMAIRGYTI